MKLIFKKAERKRIENYRPISLLCVDYKILAKIVTERMKKVLKQVIEVEQQGFIKDGDIKGNLLLVKEIIEYCNEEEKEGFLIMMDFMKAYDRVDREAIVETLRAMNFGEKIMDMVKLLYSESTAKVVINGDLGEAFETKGGVKQGCPLSPYLFILVLELMAIEMRESPDIEGIKLEDKDKAQPGDPGEPVERNSNQNRSENCRGVYVGEGPGDEYRLFESL